MNSLDKMEDYDRLANLCEKQAQEINSLARIEANKMLDNGTYSEKINLLVAEIAEKDRKLAEQQEKINGLEKQAVCDHDWHEQDDSFGHEFGTEIIVYDLCEKCGATKECEPYDYDDN